MIAERFGRYMLGKKNADTKMSTLIGASGVKLEGCNEHILKLVRRCVESGIDRKSTRLNSSHMPKSRMPSSA